MPQQKNLGPALRYHRQTAHDRWTLGGHGLDWENQPDVFKRYPEGLKLSTHPLPEPAGFPAVPLQEALHAAPQPGKPMDEAALGRVLLQAYGPTAQSRHRSGTFYYRSAPSAGALYPTELYLALGAPLDQHRQETGPSLGLHHYAPLGHRLTGLGRPRALHDLAAACKLGQGLAPTAAFVASAIFFRSSWKYRARAYRYCLLDTGHMLENLLLALRAEGLAASLYYDFDDAACNALLGLPTAQEAALAVVFVHGQPAEEPPKLEEPVQTPRDVELEPASRVSGREQRYQEIEAVHRASEQPPPAFAEGGAQDAAAAAGWQDVLESAPVFEPFVGEGQMQASLHETLLARRSKRNFVAQELSEEETAALVRLFCVADPPPPGGKAAPPSPLLVSLAVQRASGLNDGLYALQIGDCSLGRVHAGSMGQGLAHVCLGQEWLQHANLLCGFVCNLRGQETRLGPRAYRHAMLEAGRLGERAYLAATALGLGACGIGAFFDQEAATLLDVDDRAQPLYFMAVGKVRR